MASPVLDIDVGGTKIRTTISTLKQAPYLEALLRHEAAGTMSVTKTDEGLIFIDRSPELFMMVVEGLRAGGQIFTESALQTLALLKELEFYGLNASCPEMDAWESSVTDDLVVSYTRHSPPQVILGLESSKEVLEEVGLLIGVGGAVVKEFYGRQRRLLHVPTSHANPSLTWHCLGLQLRGLLSSIGFAERTCTILQEEGITRYIKIFSRKKLRQFEQPFVINIELTDHHEAACEESLLVGASVLAHSLEEANINGKDGRVVGHQRDRVVVEFPNPIGERALNPKNLLVTAASSGGSAAAAANADYVQATDGLLSASIGPLVNSDLSSTQQSSSDVKTQSAQMADGMKSQAVELDMQEALQQSEHEALQKEQADLSQAIIESKLESHDGVVLRLTHHHDDPEVFKALMEAEALADCRRRVTEAGCELTPAWGNGAIFLIPFRERSKYQELQFQGVSLDDLKPYNIVALRDDESSVKQALTQVPRRRRPQCKREGASSTGSNAISASTVASESPGESSETAMATGSAPDPLPEVRVDIVRTFLTFSSATCAQTSEASGDSRGCRSAPVVKH